MILCSIISLFIFALSMIGARVSRMCGGGAPKLPYGLDQHIFALPWGAVGLILGIWFVDLSFYMIPSYVTTFVIAYGSAFLGKRIGHGQYFDLATSLKHITAEKIDFLLRPFFGKDAATTGNPENSSYIRDLVGLSLTGTVVSLGISILAFIAGHYLFFTILLLTSTAKGVVYAVCRKYPNLFQSGLETIGAEFTHDKETEIAEFVNGYVSTAGIAAYIAYLTLLLIT